MIPHIIHSIWFQGWDSLPAKYNANVKSVIDLNPGWQYKKWDESSITKLISDLGPTYLSKFNSFKYLHQKIDFGRYAILYSFGGVSVDIDAMAVKGFDTLPMLNSSDFMVSKNSTNGFVTNATILVSEKNSTMKELLDSVSTDCGSAMTEFGCIQNTTGPKSFNKFVDLHKDKITVLSNVYFEPCSGRDSFCKIGPDTILDHRHDWSWVSPAAKGLMNVYYDVKHYWVTILFIIVGFLLLYFFMKEVNK